MTPLDQHGASELFRQPPHRFIDVGNGEVAVRSVGEGPDVVFSHGWPVSGATFRTLLPHLSGHVRCHLLDYPGAGQSRFTRSTRLSLADHAAALRATVEQLGLATFAVVGHNSGGLIARLAFAGDARVRGWGLINTEQPKPSWRFSSFIQTARLPRFEQLFARLVNTPRLSRNKFLLGDCFADRSLTGGEFAEFFLHPLRSDPERLWAAGEFGRHFDIGALAKLLDLHRQITAPVALVWGADDPFFPVARAREMLTTFGGEATLHEVPNGKLFVHEEFPEQTAHGLLGALRA